MFLSKSALLFQGKAIFKTTHWDPARFAIFFANNTSFLWRWP
jgi:hypothetical protein